MTYAYLVLALGVPLTLDLLAGAGGVGSGADQPNRVFTVIGSTLTVGALLTAVLTIRKIVETRLPAPEWRRSAP